MKLGLTRLARRVTGVVSGLATSASVLTRTSAVTAYPPTTSFTRPIDWQDGDKAVMQWSTDQTFATGVTETTTPQTMLTGTTTYNFGLSAIAAGVVYMRLAAWRGTRPGSLNWSNLQGVGNAAVPTISTSTMADYQFAPGTLALVASMTSTWAIVGGADMAQFTISGSTLSSLTQAITKTMIVQVQATSLFGVASAIQTITDTVAANTASAFPFTNVVNATLATVYTSNTITVAGIVGAGVTNPISITGAGTYSKNGGAYGVASSTVVNGDTITLHDTSTAVSDATTVQIGATTSTWVVTTNATVSIAVLTSVLGTSRNMNIAISGSPALSWLGTVGGAAFAPSRATIQQSPNLCQFELTVTALGSGFFGIGLDDGTFACNSGFPCPGYTTSTGWALVWNVNTLAVNWNTAGNNFQFGALTYAVNDVYTVRVNKTLGTMDVWLTRAGTTTKQGGQATGLPALSAYYAFVAPRNAEAGTMNFGASAFTKALDNGYANYG